MDTTEGLTESWAAATDRFFALRDAGWDGPVDQDGRPVYDVDAWIATHTEVMRPLYPCTIDNPCMAPRCTHRWI